MNPDSAPPNPLLRTLVFDSFNPSLMGDALQGSQLAHVQLGGGRFRGALWQSRLDDARVAWGRYNLPVVAVGDLPRDFITIGLLLHTEPESGSSEGRRLSPEDVLVIPEGHGLHVRLQPGTEWISLQVRRQALEAMGIELPSTESTIHRIESIDRDAVHSVIAAVAGIIGPGQARDGGSASAQSLAWCHSELAEVFARVIGAGQPSAVRGGADRRRILSRVEEYLEADSMAPVRMDEVCLAAGTTLRTLERTFRDALGVSPKRYFSLRRLTDARAALIEAALRRDPTASVTDIAMACGFFHLGRFSVDYKNAYGESPSETLKGRG